MVVKPFFYAQNRNSQFCEGNLVSNYDVNRS
jgi:hypothetical protein